jgi:hypothetical protein
MYASTLSQLDYNNGIPAAGLHYLTLSLCVVHSSSSQAAIQPSKKYENQTIQSNLPSTQHCRRTVQGHSRTHADKNSVCIVYINANAHQENCLHLACPMVTQQSDGHPASVNGGCSSYITTE